MPLDLSANDPTMQLYVTNLLADLHGKTPAPAMRSSTSCSPPVRWNVSHCPEFHQPGPGILSLEDEKKAASKSNIEDQYVVYRIEKSKSKGEAFHTILFTLPLTINPDL